MLHQFARFAGVGTIAYLVDAGVLSAVLALAPGRFYLGRLMSYLAAATVAWALNRCLTFGRSDGSRGREWARYLVVNLGGGLANYLVYLALIETVALCRSYPPLAVGAGSIAGLVLNFTASRRFVFTGGRT